MVSSTAVLLLQVTLVASSALAAAAAAEKKPAEPAVVAAADEPATTTGRPPSAGREPKNVSILKQINKVNDDGSYTFGYEASDGSFKVETRDVAGNVKGMFGFVDEAGRLKRVSYSASNSSGFQAAVGGTSSSSSSSPPVDPSSAAPTSTSSSSSSSTSSEPPPPPPPAVRYASAAATAVKKVLVSKRPVPARHDERARDDETERRRREGSDPRRQLPRNDGADAPDVYGGVHGRSSMESGPVSPVVSALMSELQLVPVRAYRPPLPPADAYDDVGAANARQDTISRQAEQEDDEPQYRRQPVTVQYRRPQPSEAFQQQQQQPQQTTTVVYQQQQQQQQQPPLPVAYGPNLVAFRDELMELILTFVQARVSQLVSLASPSPYPDQPLPPPLPLPLPYPMPYQQPNYYVPSYYQGPRMPSSGQPVGGFVLRQLPSSALPHRPRDDYVAAAASDAPQHSSPKVTQALKDGLIRMLLSTSPRYDPDRNREWSTPSATFRRTTQSTPVRSVQIVRDDDSAGDSRPVTTESPD